MKQRTAFKRRMNNLLPKIRSGEYDRNRSYVRVGYYRNRGYVFTPDIGSYLNVRMMSAH